MSEHPRPRPQYGEYADPAPATEPPPRETLDGAAQPGESVEGADAGLQAGESATPAPLAPPAPQLHPAPHAHSASTSGPLPGVPHNLGVSGASSSYSAAAPTPAQHGDPYRAAAPPVAAPLPATDPAGQQTPTQQPAPTAYFGAAPAAASSPAAARPPKRADRIVTILLLALGAYGALSLGLAMVQLPAQLRLAATVLKIDGFALPQPVATIGTIGAVLMLTIYAVALIFSIQRLRGRRLAFWVPLAAGALAFIVFFALAMIAYAQSAELLQAMSQPDALGSILDYSATAGR